MTHTFTGRVNWVKIREEDQLVLAEQPRDTPSLGQANAMALTTHCTPSGLVCPLLCATDPINSPLNEMKRYMIFGLITLHLPQIS